MSDAEQPYKLLLSYEVNLENMQEYYRFMLGRYVPVMQAMGLEMSDAWHTAYGELPNRLIGFVAPEKSMLDEVMENDTWSSLNEELQRFVSDFEYKVVAYREGFQF